MTWWEWLTVPVGLIVWGGAIYGLSAWGLDLWRMRQQRAHIQAILRDERRRQARGDWTYWDGRQWRRYQ